MWRDEVTYLCTLIVTAITIANAMRERKMSLVPSFLKKRQQDASANAARQKASSARSLMIDLAIRWSIVFYSVAGLIWLAVGPGRGAPIVRGDLGLVGTYLFNVILVFNLAEKNDRLYHAMVREGWRPKTIVDDERWSN